MQRTVVKPDNSKPASEASSTTTPQDATQNPTLPPSAAVQPLQSIEQGANDPLLKSIQQRVKSMGPVPRMAPPGTRLSAPKHIGGAVGPSRKEPSEPAASSWTAAGRSLDPGRWKAAEAMLRSARLLEVDAKRTEQAGNSEEAMALRSMAESLRGQVQRLLALSK